MARVTVLQALIDDLQESMAIMKAEGTGWTAYTNAAKQVKDMVNELDLVRGASTGIDGLPLEEQVARLRAACRDWPPQLLEVVAAELAERQRATLILRSEYGDAALREGVWGPV